MTLEELSSCGHPWVELRARAVLDIQQGLAQGELTVSEAQELMEDLCRTDRVEKEADSVELRAALVMAITLAAKAL
jgi:hypothetical protein